MENARLYMSRELQARRAAPAWTLLAVNVIPLIGVLLWNWSAFHIVALYWFENVIIGLINVFKIAIASSKGVYRNMPFTKSPPQPVAIPLGGTESIVLKAFLIPFFLWHFGMFCFIHGIFVYVWLGGGFEGASADTSLFDLSGLFDKIFSGTSLIAALALAGSHLFSFAYHYIGKGEYRESNPIQLMFAPYARVFVLHVALIAGAFGALLLDEPIALLAMLVIGKTILDWRLHARAHA